MQADVFVFHHDALCLRQRCRDVQILGHIFRRRRQSRPKLSLRLGNRRDRQAIHRTDVHAGVALDTQRGREVRLDIAIETALHFGGRLLRGVAQLHLFADTGKSLHEFGMRHLRTRRRIEFVAEHPRVHPHLGAFQMHALCGAVRNVFAEAMLVNRDGGLMSVLHSPDDVLRSPRSVPAEEHVGARRLERRLVDHRHVPLVERDPDVSLNPRERIVLADGEDNGVAWHDDRVEHGAGLTPVYLAPFQPFKLHADQLPVLDHEPLGGVILDDVDAFFLSVVEFPR